MIAVCFGGDKVSIRLNIKLGSKTAERYRPPPPILKEYNMKKRKKVARRNRYFTWNVGNSKADDALFTSGKRKEYANFIEGIKDLK